MITTPQRLKEYIDALTDCYDDYAKKFHDIDAPPQSLVYCIPMVPPSECEWCQAIENAVGDFINIYVIYYPAFWCYFIFWFIVMFNLFTPLFSEVIHMILRPQRDE
jgi:hypothetical protein